MDPLSAEEIRRVVQAALAEDLGPGDATTLAMIPESVTANAAMIAREPLTVAGLEFAEAAFRELAPEVRIERAARDGQRAEARAVLVRVEGPARALLTAERVALNFVQRLSGIATLTASFV
ncbi:MAG TPA: nicotinate-nucleotide diphosphorylase (carboxylating), partial [Verrucomicrobiae bacterium]|nr:nicotinate-nucleotide diphosphorylase (carboxylating) [Verrucomicrobiae bacterium]